MQSRILPRLVALIAAIVVIVACQPKTVIVKETVEVEKEVEKVVKETVIVEGTPAVVEKEVTKVVEIEIEKVVTSTPVSGPVPSVEVYLLSTASSPLGESLLEGCRVTHVQVEYAQLQEMIHAGQESFIFYTYATDLPSLVQDKAVVPLDDLPGIDKGEYIDVLVEALTYKGGIYGVPRDFSALALYYNEDLFDQAGVSYPHNDWTWDDLRAAAQAIPESVGLGLVVVDWPFIFADFVLRNDGWVMAPDFSDTGLDNEEAIEAGKFYTGARQVEGWAILPEDAGVRSPNEAFGEGHVAMIVYFYSYRRYLCEAYSNLNCDVVQAPAGWAGKKGNLVFVTGYAVSASSDAEAIQAAKDAIACLTSEQSQIELWKSARVLPSRKSLGPYVQDDDPTAYALFAEAEFATPYNWGPHHGEVYLAIQDALNRIFQEGWPVEDSFYEAGEAIRKIIAE